MNAAETEEQLLYLHTASFGWALACCGRDREEAEEVLQTTYVKVLSESARFAGRSTFKTWLFAVIRRTASERWRRRRLGIEVLARWLRGAPSPRPVATPEVLARQSQTSQRLLATLTTLPRRQRETAELVFYHDLSLEDAAGVLGISIGSARTHYARAKKNLAEQLRDLEPEGGR